MADVKDRVAAFHQGVAFIQWLGTSAPQGPMDALPDYAWLDLFRAAGPHHVDLVGCLEYVRGADGGIQTNAVVDQMSIVSRSDLIPPKRLYRAASPGFEDRWSWFETFAMAKLVADDRAGGLRIWTCTAAEVFASVTISRTEQGGFKHSWNEWIVIPANVREINR